MAAARSFVRAGGRRCDELLGQVCMAVVKIAAGLWK